MTKTMTSHDVPVSARVSLDPIHYFWIPTHKIAYTLSILLSCGAHIDLIFLVGAVTTKTYMLCKLHLSSMEDAFRKRTCATIIETRLLNVIPGLFDAITDEGAGLPDVICTMLLLENLVQNEERGIMTEGATAIQYATQDTKVCGPKNPDGALLWGCGPWTGRLVLSMRRHSDDPPIQGGVMDSLYHI